MDTFTDIDLEYEDIEILDDALVREGTHDLEESTTFEDDCTKPENCKKSANWTDSAILALIALYEAKTEIGKRKSSAVWKDISMELKILGHFMEADQVRWKMNALIKCYKEVEDNNNKSGRGRKDFRWYEQMKNLFGHREIINCSHTITSTFPTMRLNSTEKLLSNEKLKQNVETMLLQKNDYTHLKNNVLRANNINALSSGCNKTIAVRKPKIENSSTTEKLNENVTQEKKKLHSMHGTGSSVARKKIVLEEQWIDYLKNRSHKDNEQEKVNKYILGKQDEKIILQKRMIMLKEREMEWKEKIERRKYESKMERHKEKLAVEREKCNLLYDILRITKDNYSDSLSKL
ncbi:uncharacterized protein [Prorops nasuta]|uniref:uncharacterized protein n=1 Tax=Prorops nasuta TaxID=863751 RepID=UPI0034CFA813